MKRPFENLDDHPFAQDLLQKWKGSTRYERGMKLRHLRPTYTLRELARFFPCSNKEIRNCIELAGFPGWLPPTMGKKKALKQKREFRAFEKKCKKITSGQAGRILKNKLVRTLTRWFADNMPMSQWDRFFSEQEMVPSARQEVRRPVLWTTCALDGGWEAIIAATKPMEKKTSYDSLFGFYREWLSRWYPRCMPVPEIAERGLDRTRNLLRRRVKCFEKKTGRKYDWIRPYW